MKVILLIVFFAFCGSIDARVKRVSCARCAHIDQLPFYAIITQNGRRVCSGALISLKHVLTAAHCVAGKVPIFYKRLAVRTGTDNLQYGGTNQAIKRIIWHKDYVSKPKIEHDVAIIILNADIQQTFEQKPIALPNSGPIIEKDAVFAGFGTLQRQNQWVRDVFQYYTTPVKSFARCAEEDGLADGLHENAFCITPDKDVYTEKGDSGGALVQDGKVVGIASWTKLSSPNKPVIFMNVYSYLGFINTVISSPLAYCQQNPHSTKLLTIQHPMSPSRPSDNGSKKPKML